jgi:hypothetical protein
VTEAGKTQVNVELYGTLYGWFWEKTSMKELIMPMVIVALAVVPLSAQCPAAPKRSPKEVVEQFCELDAAGKQLTSEGWPEVARLFARPTTPRRGKVIVVKDFVIPDAMVVGNKAELWVEYIYLGQLNSAGRFSDLYFPPEASSVRGPVKVRVVYNLILAERHWQPGADGGPAREITGPAEWRIEGSAPEPRVTVDTALRYLTHMRDKSSDPVIKKNADRSIATLKRLR